MRQMGLVILSASAVAGLGCQTDQSGIEKKLADIDNRLAGIEKAIQEGARAGAARPQPRRPPGPDPSKVYAVPIEGAAFKGAEHAKVTIVEAFEFA